MDQIKKKSRNSQLNRLKTKYLQKKNHQPNRPKIGERNHPNHRINNENFFMAIYLSSLAAIIQINYCQNIFMKIIL